MDLKPLPDHVCPVCEKEIPQNRWVFWPGNKYPYCDSHPTVMLVPVEEKSSESALSADDHVHGSFSCEECGNLKTCPFKACAEHDDLAATGFGEVWLEYANPDFPPPLGPILEPKFSKSQIEAVFYKMGFSEEVRDNFFTLLEKGKL